jgi:hypothetical protein
MLDVALVHANLHSSWLIDGVLCHEQALLSSGVKEHFVIY